MLALTLTQFQKTKRDGIALQEHAIPELKSHQILVRLKAAAFNPADSHIARGEMKLMSPVKPPFVLGVDGAGIVEKIGTAVRNLVAGDEVFFYTGLVDCGTLGEYIAIDAKAVARKPAGWSFEQAAAAALSLLCAHLALSRTQVKAGQRVLIHGGGGAVGSAAIVLAHALGALVDTTASDIDIDYLQSLGARQVFNYKTCAFNSLPQANYDMVLEGMGGSMLLQSIPLLNLNGSLASLKVMTDLDDMLRMGMKPPIFVKWLLPLLFRKYIRATQKAGVHLIGIATYADGATLTALGERICALGYAPRIAQTFALVQALEAWEFFNHGSAKGKVVVTM